MLFVGTDVGGTFTDVVIFDEESRKSPEVIKVPTDLKRPELAIVKALGKYQGRTEQFALVSHATTIATNSLLTQSGLAATALITNEGFRDVLEIGRQRRPEIYNLNTERPKQLVQRKDRFMVKGRRLVNGSSLAPLAEKALLKVSAEIISRGIESVAISFLNSYINPADEIRAEEILRRSGFKGHVDLSSRIDPQYREYERTSTTVVNASLAPSISRYLQRLKKELEQIGIESPLYVMNSDGTASTIAHIDETGNLKVGPESAGADPGPAAYGNGGTQATVTDANIVAGRINASKLLGGQLKLHNDLSIRAIGTLSRRLGTSIDKTADRILRIVNSNMSKALRLVSVERGRDPREYSLIAFGGAGPVHACDLAEELEIKRIIVPLHPGLFSALGLLTADLSRTFTQPIIEQEATNIEPTFTQLRGEVRKSMKQEGFTSYRTIEQVDLRYHGQAYEITLPYKKNIYFPVQAAKVLALSKNTTRLR